MQRVSQRSTRSLNICMFTIIYDLRYNENKYNDNLVFTRQIPIFFPFLRLRSEPWSFVRFYCCLGSSISLRLRLSRDQQPKANYSDPFWFPIWLHPQEDTHIIRQTFLLYNNLAINKDTSQRRVATRRQILVFNDES